MLDTGLPNLYPTPPPLVTGASSNNPLLIPRPSQGAPQPSQGAAGSNPPSGSGPCQGTSNPLPCILTAQVTNTRQNASLYEDVFTTSYVANTFDAHKQQFLVDQSGVPTTKNPNKYNPVYAQPLYISNFTITGANCVGGTTCNVLFIVTTNGEVYAYDADYQSATGPATCGTLSGSPPPYGPGHYGCLWARDEINGTTWQTQGLKHNCDFPRGFNNGASVINPQKQLLFAGVVSTPVIDLTNGLLYLVNLCEQPLVTNSQQWYLNALSISTGANYTGTYATSPVQISYNAIQPYGPQQLFSQGSQLQRASLLLTGRNQQLNCNPSSSNNYCICISGPCSIYESLIVGFEGAPSLVAGESGE